MQQILVMYSPGISLAKGMNNRTRGVFHLGGIAPSNGNNTLVYITIQSTGNSVDFGDLAQGGDDGKEPTLALSQIQFVE